MEKTVKTRECKFVVRIPPEGIRTPEGELGDDIHIVKELITYTDNTTERHLRVVKDFKKPFWITKESKQKHHDKKEATSMDNVIKYYATAKDMNKAVASKLGYKYANVRNPRVVNDSPYVYGVNNNTEAIIKKKYMDAFPDAITPYDRCFFDIEVDIPTDVILVASVVFEDTIHVIVNKDFVRHEEDPKQKIRDMYKDKVPQIPSKDYMELNIIIEDSEKKVFLRSFQLIHARQPDILAIWNASYDIGKIVDKCMEYGIHPRDLFSDPSVPKEYRFFEHKKALDKKVTESGKVTPVAPEDRWNVFISASSFYILDAMATYSYVRVGGAKVPTGYGLDSILKKEVDLAKLKFDDEPKFKGADWHIHMVRNKQIEYIVYNIFDSLSMLELDNETDDLKNVLALLSGISSFSIFNSGPKKIVDAMHVFYNENGLVLGSKPNTPPTPSPLGLKSWILTLQASKLKTNVGLKLLKDNPGMHTNIVLHVYDSDELLAA